MITFYLTSIYIVKVILKSNAFNFIKVHLSLPCIVGKISSKLDIIIEHMF